MMFTWQVWQRIFEERNKLTPLTPLFEDVASPIPDTTKIGKVWQVLWIDRVSGQKMWSEAVLLHFCIPCQSLTTSDIYFACDICIMASPMSGTVRRCLVTNHCVHAPRGVKY